MRHPVALSNLDIFQNFQTRIRLSVHQFDSTLEELSAAFSLGAAGKPLRMYSDGLRRMIPSSGPPPDSGCACLW